MWSSPEPPVLADQVLVAGCAAAKRGIFIMLLDARGAREGGEAGDAALGVVLGGSLPCAPRATQSYQLSSESKMKKWHTPNLFDSRPP